MVDKHVVVLTTWYPSYANPSRCVFTEQIVKAQAERNEYKISVVVPTPIHEFLNDLPYRVFNRRRRGPKNVTVYRPVFVKIPRSHFEDYKRRAKTAVERTLSRLDRPDVLHVHGLIPAGYIASRVARRFGVPCIMHVHESGLLNSDVRQLNRQILLWADLVVAVSEDVKTKICTLVPELRGRCEVVFNGVRLPPRKNSVPIEFRRGSVLFVGNLLPIKGIPVLLKAVRILHNRGHQSVRLDLIGDGPQRNRYSRLAARLDAHARFLGRLSNDRVLDRLGDYRVLVLSSYYETFGIVLIEALSRGVPVVASNVGAVPEIVRDGIDGILVPAGDPRKLAEGIAAALEHCWNVGAVMDRGYQFSIALTAERINSLYGRLLQTSQKAWYLMRKREGAT